MKTDPLNWKEELIKRIDGIVKKGRFAQDLSILIDKDFIVPTYIQDAITFIAEKKKIKI